MTVWAVDGAAGCGKTYRLMETIAEAQRVAPLLSGQRILALTYMRGSRLRLDSRLRESPDLRGRYSCVTIDSFARRLRDRWRTLGRSLGLPDPEPEPVDFDAQCDLAGALLERSAVREWIAASFPIVLLDEAQDLAPERLRIFRALAEGVSLHIASDDFQCLNPALRPSPVAQWLPTVCTPETVTKPQRTSVQGLLDAAWAIRGGGPPTNGPNFCIVPTPSVPLAAAWLAGAITHHNKGSVAVITPSHKGNFAQRVVTEVGSKPCGKNKHGPYVIRWENSDEAAAEALLETLVLPDPCSIPEAIMAIAALQGHRGAVQQTIVWMRRQSNALGRDTLDRKEIDAYIKRQVANIRTRSGARARLGAMTVHQAKNREFVGVVIIWPFTVGGDDEAKRRLLYNAITRAKQWCTVLVQSPDLLKNAPFA